MSRYVHLRSVSPAAAERFLSGYFQGVARFSVQLVDPSTAASLSPTEMVDAVVSDSMGRARNDFPEDAAEAARLSRAVAEVRRVGARSPGVMIQVPPDAYTLDEVDRAIALLKPHKSTVRGTNAAVLAEVPAGRRLTRALVNLSRASCVTARLWSLRQFSPIHKSGPLVVRNTSCLRPISFACEMASVQDALWNLRNAAALEAYAGPSQQGGSATPFPSSLP